MSQGAYALGSDSECEFVLDEPGIKTRHAVFLVSRTDVSIEPEHPRGIASVRVNDDWLAGSDRARNLSDCDLLSIGDAKILFVDMQSPRVETIARCTRLANLIQRLFSEGYVTVGVSLAGLTLPTDLLKRFSTIDPTLNGNIDADERTLVDFAATLASRFDPDTIFAISRGALSRDDELHALSVARAADPEAWTDAIKILGLVGSEAALPRLDEIARSVPFIDSSWRARESARESAERIRSVLRAQGRREASVSLIDVAGGALAVSTEPGALALHDSTAPAPVLPTREAHVPRKSQNLASFVIGAAVSLFFATIGGVLGGAAVGVLGFVLFQAAF